MQSPNFVLFALKIIELKNLFFYPLTNNEYANH